ncbi:MAG: hypothetical protein ABW022_08660 [Actinoplanes sp.]
MVEHAAADEIIGGAYLYKSTVPGKISGCFHGCLAAEVVIAERQLGGFGDDLGVMYYRNGWEWHEDSERLFGIPVPLGMLLDNIFETVSDLSRSAGADFAVDTLRAMAPGADLQTGMEMWFASLLTDYMAPLRGVVGTPVGEYVAEMVAAIGDRHAGRDVDWESLWEYLGERARLFQHEKEPSSDGWGEWAERHRAAAFAESLCDYFDGDNSAVKHALDAVGIPKHERIKFAETLIVALGASPIVTAPRPAPLAYISDTTPVAELVGAGV